MKLSPRDALAYFRKPDPNRTGLLIFGADGMRVAQRRAEVIAALVGPQGEAEMRLTRLPAADLRKDAPLLLDGIKSQSFFPGPRVVFVEDATDALVSFVAPALTDWQPGDAQIIVTAGALTAKSALRKLFEAHPNAFAVGLYDDPPSRDEIDMMLVAANLKQLSRDAMDALVSLSRTLDPGDFRQTVEKLGLYMLNTGTEVQLADVDACAPLSAEADLDDLITQVAEGKAGQIAPLLRRIVAQGANPVGICIGFQRYFRQLLQLATAAGGPSVAVQSLRPPVFGPRREALIRQAGGWNRDALEYALTEFLDTDLTLRSSSKAPDAALIERALVRVAMRARK